MSPIDLDRNHFRPDDFCGSYRWSYILGKNLFFQDRMAAGPEQRNLLWVHKNIQTLFENSFCNLQDEGKNASMDFSQW